MFTQIVIGYIPTPEGLAALDTAIQLAKEGGAHLTVVNTGRDGNYADPTFASAKDIDHIDLQLAARPSRCCSTPPAASSPSRLPEARERGRCGGRSSRAAAPAMPWRESGPEARPDAAASGDRSVDSVSARRRSGLYWRLTDPGTGARGVVRA